ncbi:hypothetical protein, partial [Enterobacter hormaechei]
MPRSTERLSVGIAQHVKGSKDIVPDKQGVKSSIIIPYLIDSTVIDPDWHKAIEITLHIQYDP